jgi:hypothetical protein
MHKAALTPRPFYQVKLNVCEKTIAHLGFFLFKRCRAKTKQTQINKSSPIFPKLSCPRVMTGVVGCNNDQLLKCTTENYQAINYFFYTLQHKSQYKVMTKPYKKGLTEEP